MLSLLGLGIFFVQEMKQESYSVCVCVCVCGGGGGWVERGKFFSLP